jgi:hypothetical protein
MDFLVTKPCDAIRHLDGIASEFATTATRALHVIPANHQHIQIAVASHFHRERRTQTE